MLVFIVRNDAGKTIQWHPVRALAEALLAIDHEGKSHLIGTQRLFLQLHLANTETTALALHHDTVFEQTDLIGIERLSAHPIGPPQLRIFDKQIAEIFDTGRCPLLISHLCAVGRVHRQFELQPIRAGLLRRVIEEYKKRHRAIAVRLDIMTVEADSIIGLQLHGFPDAGAGAVRRPVPTEVKLRLAHENTMIIEAGKIRLGIVLLHHNRNWLNADRQGIRRIQLQLA